LSDSLLFLSRYYVLPMNCGDTKGQDNHEKVKQVLPVEATHQLSIGLTLLAN